MSDIEKRLTKLESRLRTYQIAFAGLAIGAGFMMLSGFGKHSNVPDVIQAKEFQVVDANGKILVSMKKDTTGGGRVNIHNNKGTNVLYLHSGYAGGRIALSDNDGNSGLIEAITDDGHGVVNVYNKSNKRIGAIGGDSNGNGVLNVYNNAGENMNGVWPKQ